MSQESLNVERLAGRYGFLAHNGLLPLPSKDGITLVVELSRLEYASVCLPLLLNHSGTSVTIIAVAMTPHFPLETLASQFSSEERILLLPFEPEDMVNKAFAVIETTFAVLLEDSIMVSAGWLSELMWVIADDAAVKIVAPCSASESGEGKKRLHFGTYLEMATHVSFSLSRNQGEWRQVEVLSGSCLLFTKDLIQQIGGLDTSLQVRHLIIADWCLRARQVGARLALSDAVYVHAIHSLDTHLRKLDEHKQDMGWQLYCQKWSLESNLESSKDNVTHLVPHSDFLNSKQQVIPLSNGIEIGPIVTAIVYGDGIWESGEDREYWQEMQQQSYKNIRWIWIRELLVNADLPFPVNEHAVVISVSGEVAWLQALKNAPLLYEDEIILYLSGSVRYGHRYIERVVKAITQGSANLIVSISTEMEEADVHLLAGDESEIVLPLERVAYTRGVIPGRISNKDANTRQLQLLAESSLRIGYIGDFSEVIGSRTESRTGKEAHQ